MYDINESHPVLFLLDDKFKDHVRKSVWFSIESKNEQAERRFVCLKRKEERVPSLERVPNVGTSCTVHV